MLLVRQLLLKRILLILFLSAGSSLFLLPRQAAAVQVTLILRNITTDNFNEWKVESDLKCTQCTGKIRRDTEAFEQTWYVGHAGDNIRFWWGRLSGEADATVLVNNVVVFSGHCLHGGSRKARMIDTCAYPSVYKTGGPGPYLIESPDRSLTYVHFATSMLPRRFYSRGGASDRRGVSGSLIALGVEQRGSAASLESLKGKTNAKVSANTVM